MTLEKTSRREVSSPESETGRKGSKSGAPAEIGKYHMYDIFISFSLLLLFRPNLSFNTREGDSYTRARGYKTFFVLNLVEHEISNAHMYKNIKKFSFCQAQISGECYFSCS